jgi:hypothetical protein
MAGLLGLEDPSSTFTGEKPYEMAKQMAHWFVPLLKTCKAVPYFGPRVELGLACTRCKSPAIINPIAASELLQEQVHIDKE